MTSETSKSWKIIPHCRTKNLTALPRPPLHRLTALLRPSAFDRWHRARRWRWWKAPVKKFGRVNGGCFFIWKKGEVYQPWNEPEKCWFNQREKMLISGWKFFCTMKKCWFKQPEITVEPEKDGNCTKWTRNVRLKLGSQAMKLHHELMGRSVSAFWILWDVVLYTDAILKCLSHPGLVCENPRESHVPFHQFWDSSKSKEISGYPPRSFVFWGIHHHPPKQ